MRELNEDVSIFEKISLALKYLLHPGYLLYLLIFALMMVFSIQAVNDMLSQMSHAMLAMSSDPQDQMAEVMQGMMSGDISEEEGKSRLEALINAQGGQYNGQINMIAQAPASTGFSGLISFLSFVFSILFTFKSFDCMARIARGEDEAPSFMPLSIMSWTTPLKFFAVIIVVMIVSIIVMVLLGFIPIIGALAGLLLSLFISLMFPAMTTLMVQTESFGQAINPSNWIGFVREMGVGRYAVMLLVLFLFSLIPSILFVISIPSAENFANSSVVPSIPFIAVVVISVSTALLSGFFYTFLGYMSRVEVDEANDMGGVSQEVNIDLRMANQAWQAGNHEDAVQSLLVTINNTSDWQYKRPLLTRVFEYYDKMGQPQKKEIWIEQMIEQVATKAHQDFSHVHGFVKEKVAKNEVFKPQLIYPLANLALINGDAELAVRLTKGFAKKHPNHIDISGNYFVAAKGYKALRKNEQAYKILAHLIKNYPNDEEMPEIKAVFADVKAKVKAKQALAKARAEKENKT